MKRFYIEDFYLFNQEMEKPFIKTSKDILKVVLFDLKTDLYYQYINTNFNPVLHQEMTLKDFLVDKQYVSINLEASFSISDQKFNEILNMKVPIFKRYYKNNFLKLIDLEEMII
jgi:hypothetical protein